MESWRKVFRTGLVPNLSDAALAALHQALVIDDKRLLQGATTQPPPLLSLLALYIYLYTYGIKVYRMQCVQDWPCETVADVEAYFAMTCWEIDKAMGEPAACRWLLNWFDDTPRDTMIAELLPEVELAISQRAWKEVTTDTNA